MKEIKDYIIEKLIVNNTIQSNYKYHPKDTDDLIKCIQTKIKNEGLGTKKKPLDLNDIDTSKIEDMSYLFYYLNKLRDLSIKGCFDISAWDVSNVKYMDHMFLGSAFNGDISNWNVSNVEDMIKMFEKSKFNGNISDWDVSKVKNMYEMFSESKFNGDINNWDINSNTNIFNMFYDCPLESNPPKWYKE